MCMGVDAFTRLQHRDRRQSVSTLLEPDLRDLVCAARKATGRLPDDVRRILACRGLDDLAFVVLITILELEPLVSSNAPPKYGLIV